MLSFFICLIISVILSFGLAILFVEKGNEFPIKRYRVILQQFVHDKIHWKAAQVFYCSVCFSFWASLLADVIIAIFVCSSYFFWPCSGIIACGFSWIIIEWLNAIDQEPNINVLVENQSSEDK